MCAAVPCIAEKPAPTTETGAEGAPSEEADMPTQPTAVQCATISDEPSDIEWDAISERLDQIDQAQQAKTEAHARMHRMVDDCEELLGTNRRSRALVDSRSPWSPEQRAEAIQLCIEHRHGMSPAGDPDTAPVPAASVGGDSDGCLRGTLTKVVTEDGKLVAVVRKGNMAAKEPPAVRDFVTMAGFVVADVPALGDCWMWVVAAELGEDWMAFEYNGMKLHNMKLRDNRQSGSDIR
eukprot:gene12196-14405_t